MRDSLQVVIPGEDLISIRFYTQFSFGTKKKELHFMFYIELRM